MKKRVFLLLLVVLVVIGVGTWVRGQLAVEARDQPVTEADLRILQRAAVLLKDPSTWNHHDDRVCDDDEAVGKRSLFCALQKADAEVLGSYVHRNVALQEVRFAIQDLTRDRQTEMVLRALRHFSLPHRLMDFNNLPETRFEDIHHVLRVASRTCRCPTETVIANGQATMNVPSVSLVVQLCRPTSVCSRRRLVRS